MKRLLTACFWLWLAGPAWAAPSPEEERLLARLDTARVEADTRTLSDEIVANDSGAGAGTAVAGSEDERALGDWMAARFRELGLQVRREPFAVRVFDYGKVDLQAAGQHFPAITFHSGGGTWGRRDGGDYRRGNRDGGKVLEAPLVDAGDGLRADYQRLAPVRGQVVLVRWTMWPGFMISEAAAQGAAAIVLYDYPGRSLPDALKQNTVIGRDAIPAVHVSIESARALQALLQSGPVRVALENRVDSRLGESENIVATLRGRDHPEQWLLVGAHRDRWFHGAQDDSVGEAVMLELGRALAASGPLRRSLALVSFGAEETGGAGAEYDWLTGSHAFVRSHPEIVGNVVYGFNIDGAGWSAEQGYLYSSLELHDFQVRVLADLGLDRRVRLRNGVTDVVDAWTLGVNGGASMAYLLWFESHAVDSGQPKPFSQYYHTQLDRYHPEWYGNLGSDLRVGALSLARADAAGPAALRLSRLGAWVGTELATLQSKLGTEDLPFAAAMQAAARFSQAALDFEAGPGVEAGAVLEARRRLTPWLYSLSSRGAVLKPAPYVDDVLALDRALAETAAGSPAAAAAALAEVDTMSWGSLLSGSAYAAERLSAHSAPDWSIEYDQNPRPVGPDIHAIYMAALDGGISEAQVARLQAMRAACLERVRSALFVLQGRLAKATAALEPGG